MNSTLYLISCAVLSIAVLIGISLMSRVKTAVAGNLISAVSLLLGISVTLVYNDILSAWSIFAFMLVGILVGAALAARVKMIQMPQLVALLNGLGGFASALVGILTLLGIGVLTYSYPVFMNVTSVLAIIVGLVTLNGSLIAAGKLHHLLPQKPVKWKNHTFLLNASLIILAGTILLIGFAGETLSTESTVIILIISILISSFFGIAFAVRVGGADMPITISLLNSLSGVAGAIAGMAVNDLLLVSVGGIVGASGLLLTRVMCRAMNRGLKEILTGKTSTTSPHQPVHAPYLDTEEEVPLDPILTEGQESSVNEPTEPKPVRPSHEEVLTTAKSVIIVPGYGMALAQAQHLVQQLANKLEEKGAEVKFAIHPVAGRMPGHMNVLLAEADVPYEKLFEMDAVNDDFAQTDLVVVIGANDVINPAARDAKDTPIYGMPVLNVDHAKEIIICNYDLNPGYSGVENPLYKQDEKVHLLLGDAKDSLSSLLEVLFHYTTR